ncbi:glycine--tRNA ligase subunit beta [Anaplasmataceae bacterium AB001_6]|nr:glycine--tRNA ligase subunit beta [Anaplasmataceae bacterium AB001_6]
MVSNFLFECLSEEIPFDMQCYALDFIGRYLDSNLENIGIKCSANFYVANRRLAILFCDIDVKNFDSVVTINGPNCSADDSVIKKFLQKFTLKYGRKFSKKDLEKSLEKGKERYVLQFSHDISTIKILFVDFIDCMLKNINWKKSMRWGKEDYVWVRPIRNIVALFDKDVVPFDFHGVESSNYTFAHRFIEKNKKVFLDDAKNYLKIMRKNNVIVDHVERKKLMLDAIQEFLSKNSDLSIYDATGDIVDQISSILEKPFLKLGNIKGEHRTLPKELMFNIMIQEQKFIPLIGKNGDIASQFLFFSNIESDNVIAGNEKVLEARMSDALFFVECDKKHDANYYVDSLKNVLFHEGLGSFYDKITRVQALAKYISVWVSHASIVNIERASKLYKFDIMSMVGKEYPELQGIIGSYYAEFNGENEEVVSAIRECMYPIKHHSPVTKNFVAITLAISDRIDTIVGMMIIGKKPTSSRDPLALKRSVNAIIRTVIENEIDIPLDIVINKSVSLYPGSVIKAGKAITDVKNTIRFNNYRNIIIQESKDFFENRIVNFLDFHPLFIQSLSGILLNPYRIFSALDVMNNFFKCQKGVCIVATYKRVVNIFEDIAGNGNFSIKLQKKFFVEKRDQHIDSIVTKSLQSIKKLLKADKLEESFDVLFSMSDDIKDFLDNVVINSEIKEVRKNRLSFLYKVINTYNLVANFDLLKNIYVESDIKVIE